MKYLTINPLFFIREGFGTLMGHYATMYSLCKDTDFVPVIPEINFAQKNILTAMDFFNNDYDPKNVYDHKSSFPNFTKIFHTLSELQLPTIEWQVLDLGIPDITYEDIINKIKNINHNICITYHLSKNLYNKYLTDIINYLYIFDKNLYSKAKNILPQTTKDLVGICIRNEYKKIECPHTILTLDYYIQAMRQFDNDNTKYLIFSDDIESTKQVFQYLETQFDIEYTKPMPSSIGLCLMSLCDHIICANSSFSYWASLLNKNPYKKILYSPYFIDPNKDPYLANMHNFKWHHNHDSWILIDAI